MVFYKLDHTVEKILKNSPTSEQAFLKKHLNADFSKTEAKYLSERIADHKWNVSERLKRDIGFRVAAVDYIENFYEPSSSFSNRNRKSGLLSKVLRPINSSLLRSYFISKSRILPH